MKRSDGALMLSVNDNPFAVLTAVVAPAILTNACSVLCLGTSNRIARVVDRTRIIAAELATVEPGTRKYGLRAAQLERLRVRAELLFKALRMMYASLGSFAAAALISVIGSVLAFYDQQLAFRGAAVLGLAIGGLGVVGLVTGCLLMVRETRLALRNMEEEAHLGPGQRGELDRDDRLPTI
jgi:hypothetical protein